MNDDITMNLMPWLVMYYHFSYVAFNITIPMTYNQRTICCVCLCYNFIFPKYIKQ